MKSSFARGSFVSSLLPGASSSSTSEPSSPAPQSAPTPTPPCETDISDVDDTEVYDESQGSVILSLLGQLGRNADFSRITLPTFVLEPRSMLEKLTDNISHPDLLFNAVTTADPVDRFIHVVRYYLSGWHIRPKGVRKPYNPVLGEIFRCKWVHPNHDNVTSIYVAEQVSHHPPISTYYYTCPELGVEIQGDLRPKSKYLGNSASVSFHGDARIKLAKHSGEEYIATFPTMYARGILFGTLYLELGDTVTIKCPANDLICDIEFKVKGFFTGTYNGVTGRIRRESTNEPLYTISGKWTDTIHITSADKSSPTKGTTNVLFDATSEPISHKVVIPESDQEEYESRCNRRESEKVSSDHYNCRLNVNVPSDPKQALEELTRRVFGPATSPVHAKFWPAAPSTS
ncbi:hypothetical protein SeMB42_g01370 [Synchytrium endobioticum]|uniref:Oxysterol-binding protein n=1 Tax=Synchytrium endobioticum TaxID=286115 RepID=A0A507DLP0_9FUNG|nr:hypothetical protein SeMB42_g01370 [Synchytrium endobioticum]